MDFDKVLHIATFAGRIILESGGETYRVEETICRICAAYGIRYAESFVTPTGIMVSVYDENNYTTTLVKRVTNRTVDLQKIGSIMLLVPGLSITNAIRDTIAGDLISGLIRAAEAFLVAISIAVGTGMVMSIWIYFGGGI